MLLTGLVISTLTARVQFQAESARRRERRTAALYAISRELAATQNREQIARIALQHVWRGLGRPRGGAPARPGSQAWCPREPTARWPCH